MVTARIRGGGRRREQPHEPPLQRRAVEPERRSDWTPARSRSARLSSRVSGFGFDLWERSIRAPRSMSDAV